MIEWFATVVLLPFTVAMVATYVVGNAAHGLPMTPLFVRRWIRAAQGMVPVWRRLLAGSGRSRTSPVGEADAPNPSRQGEDHHGRD